MALWACKHTKKLHGKRPAWVVLTSPEAFCAGAAALVVLAAGVQFVLFLLLSNSGTEILCSHWRHVVYCVQVCRLVSWLSDHVPPEDGTPGVAAVVHGDFRLDNMVFDPHLQVRGVCRGRG
jgi:hypothetical protein